MNCFRYGYKAGTGTPCGFAMTIRGWQVSDYGCKCPSCCRGKSREGGLFALGSMYIYVYDSMMYIYFCVEDYKKIKKYFKL